MKIWLDKLDYSLSQTDFHAPKKIWLKQDPPALLSTLNSTYNKEKYAEIFSFIVGNFSLRVTYL